MPQVAARINEQQERWLKDYFRTKSAGAEFILPWAVDTFFRAITTIKGTFTGPELKTIIAAHRDQRLLPATALMVWASAFWVSRNCSAANMDDYIASY